MSFPIRNNKAAKEGAPGKEEQKDLKAEEKDARGSSPHSPPRAAQVDNSHNNRNNSRAD